MKERNKTPTEQTVVDAPEGTRKTVRNKSEYNEQRWPGENTLKKRARSHTYGDLP